MEEGWRDNEIERQREGEQERERDVEKERGYEMPPLRERPDSRGCSVFHDLANVPSPTAYDCPVVLCGHV